MRAPEWSIVQYETEESQEPVAGILTDSAVRALPPGWPRSVIALLADWRTWQPRLRSADLSALAQVPGARLTAPITYPRKLICAGANYIDHLQEMGGSPSTTRPRPYFFLKPPSTTIVGPDAAIALPDAENAGVDWEAELAVVIADRCKNVAVADAHTHVAGYLVANDISARGLFHRDDGIAPAFAWDWYAHKALDGFCPIGPGIVPGWLVPDPRSLRITLSVNGEVKQDSNTSKLIAGVAELIAAASQGVTLEPGDVILTGTPAGVGLPRGEFLARGDEVIAEIDGLGRLVTLIT